MAGNLDGVVIVSRGKMKRQVRVEEVLFELDARLFLLVSGNADIEFGWYPLHSGVRQGSKRRPVQCRVL
jgi:hypothetical protein